MSKATSKISTEVRSRAVRMVLDHEGEHPSRWAAICSIAAKTGCTPQTLNGWLKKAEVDSGARVGVPTDVAERLMGWSGRTGSSGKPTRSSRKASVSTAGSSHNRLHRRSSRSLRGRADLQGIADCPVDLP